jgi:hypothetical protein
MPEMREQNLLKNYQDGAGFIVPQNIADVDQSAMNIIFILYF